MFQSLVMSLPAFGNVGALIGLFFFMYAYVGVMLFGKVRPRCGVGWVGWGLVGSFRCGHGCGAGAGRCT